MNRKTFHAKEEGLQRETYVVDGTGKILGRLATKVALILRGKHKPTFTTNIDCGDNVIITNAAKIKVTGGKEKKKIYFYHSGYPHGHKLLTLEEVAKRDVRRIITHAVKGMLPKGSLGNRMIKKLKVHAGHADAAGKPLNI